MNPFIILAIALIVLIFVGTVVAVYISSQRQKQKRTMAVITGRSKTESGDNKANEQDKRRAELAQKLKDQGDGEGKGKGKATLALQLRQAGMKISTRQYLIFSAISAVLCLFLTKFLLGQSIIVALLAGIVGFFGVPKYVIRWRKKRRQKKFLKEFADALEAMVRLLRAGMPVGEAIAMASREFEGPVGEEMAMIYDSQKIGVPLHEATLEAAKRMPITEMQMFATGIAIQQQTGASLSEVLTNLAGVIRSRYRLKRKVAALSAEAKASAMIIGSLPFVVGGGLYAINPEYMDPLFYTTVGQIMMAGCAFWMGIGIFSMKIMINFRV